MTEKRAAIPNRFLAGEPLERLMPYYARMCEPVPLNPRSKADWQVRRKELRQQVLECLGLAPLPERLPLDARVAATLEREEYCVERIYYQVWPGVYSSGWFYRPREVTKPLPTILNPHGHTKHGARDPVEQSRLIGLAKLGYTAFAVDSVHTYRYELGVNPVGVMTWNNLRALDYLMTRPEVDRERLGMTGASGGAQQSMYVLALDDRIRVAVLAVMVSYFRRILFPSGHHCPCNHVPAIMRHTDEPEMCGVFAPRPLLFLTVTDDWTAPFPEHELGELRNLYGVWSQPDRLDHEQFPGPHDYSQPMRERMYGWFERWLRGGSSSEPVPEPPVNLEDPASLAALAEPPAEHRGWDAVGEYYREKVGVDPPRLESRAARKSYQERTRARLRELAGSPTARCTLEVETAEEGQGDSFEWSALSFRTEPEVRVPALWLRPSFEGGGDTPRPTVILVGAEGKGAYLRKGRPAALPGAFLTAGYNVLLPDVRLRGELDVDWPHNTIIWGRPEAGMAADDLMTAVDFLCGRAEVDRRRLVVVAEGDQGVPALLAAGWDERITATVADCCGTTYRDGGEGLPVIPNILRVADVPQIASLLAPRPLWLFGVPPERVGFSSRRYYDWTRRTYQSLGEEEALRTDVGDLPSPTELIPWLEAKFRRFLR